MELALAAKVLQIRVVVAVGLEQFELTVERVLNQIPLSCSVSSFHFVCILHGVQTYGECQVNVSHSYSFELLLLVVFQTRLHAKELYAAKNRKCWYLV